MRKLIDWFNRFLLVGAVWANDVIDPKKDIELIPPTGLDKLEFISLPGIVSTLVKLILVLAALIAFIFLVIGGIKWITSGGDKEKTAVAQSTLTAALIGLVIVFGAWAIIRLIEAFFGVEILTSLTIPTVEILPSP